MEMCLAVREEHMGNCQYSRIRDQQKEFRKIEESCKRFQKRCPLSPRLKRDYVVAEAHEATHLFSASPKPAKAIGPPSFIHATGLYKEY